MIKKNKDASKEPDFIHPKEYAYRMQVHPDTALRLARQGKIDGVMAILYALDRLMRSKPPGPVQMPVAI